MSQIKDKDIAAAIDISPVTFSRWKTERPELYTRIKKSFECEAKLKALEITLDDALKIVKQYKGE
ncbi:MAG: hypothetical protein AB7S65_08170 [Sulfuricurvum sp.]